MRRAEKRNDTMKGWRCRKKKGREEDRKEERRGEEWNERSEHVLDALIGVLEAVVGEVDADRDAVQLVRLPNDLAPHRHRHPVQVS